MKKLFTAAAAAFALSSAQAFAELPAEATASFTEAKADAMTAGGIVLGIIIAIAAFKYVRRAL